MAAHTPLNSVIIVVVEDGIALLLVLGLVRRVVLSGDATATALRLKKKQETGRWSLSNAHSRRFD